ncbi:MAG: glycosyltransferase [Winogradskyella sp.]
MLSILIPTYNYNIHPLVEELYQQAIDCSVEFEIIIIDDASSDIKFNPKDLLKLKDVKLELLNKNIGRSAIRNLLAKKATFENLLFVDAGTFPKSKNFISSYLNYDGENVVIGGMTPQEGRPKKPYILRWLYTKKRESSKKRHVYTTANFLIKKSILLSHPFNESIKTYGYEDLLFFKLLKHHKFSIMFINNPVVHDCSEDAETFIKKTEDGLKNLWYLNQNYTHLLRDNSIVSAYKTLSNCHIIGIYKKAFKLTKPLLRKNLCSSYPSLIIFDLYKLGYFCNLKL